MANSRKARVLIVDAEPVSRCGVGYLLSKHARLSVGVEAETMPQARELCSQHQPEIILLDAALGDGVSFIKEVPKWCGRARVVVFTSQADALSVQRAFQAGACGYVTRRDPVVALLAALDCALEGRRSMGPQAEHVLLERMACGGVEWRGNGEAALSDRELQVFRLLGQGLGTRAVAEELRLSVKTVETHRQRIKEKLHVATGSELQRRAVLFHGATVEPMS